MCVSLTNTPGKHQITRVFLLTFLVRVAGGCVDEMTNWIVFRYASTLLE